MGYEHTNTYCKQLCWCAQGTRLLIHADRIFHWSCRTMGGRMRGSPRSCKRLVTEDSSRGYCIHNPPVIKHDIGTSSSMMFPFIILIPINPPIEFADFAMFFTTLQGKPWVSSRDFARSDTTFWAFPSVSTPRAGMCWCYREPKPVSGAPS